MTGSDGRTVGQRWVVYYLLDSRLMRATSTDQGPFDQYVPEQLQRGLISAGAGEVIAREITYLQWVRDPLSIDLVLSGVRKDPAGKTLEYVAFKRQVRVNVSGG